MTSNHLKKEAQKGISIRWKLAVYMSLFVAVVLMVMWFFQVFLLSTFFRSVKKAEMEEAANKIVAKIGSDELEATVYSEAVDRSLCVRVFRIAQNEATEVINVDATGSNLIMFLSSERLAYFYNKAYDNNGSCFSQITFGGFEVDEEDFLDKLPFQDPNSTNRVPNKNIRMIYAKISQASDNDRYMILLDASIQPLNSTVQTLVTQYFWISSIILIVAAFMVVQLYRKISAPLVRMNESAKQLALGKYDAEFSGEGYLETRELADTLNYASHELSRLDRLQKELIANISHDLRTPLTMIKGYGEVMRDVPGENTPENVQVIIDETTRLSELVNDLLDLSKLQSGARSPVISAIDLTDTVREVMTRYDALTKHQGYHVEFFAEGTAWVAADRGMLLQVVYNLINNAINYTGEDKLVTVRQTVTDGKVRISVTDTGEGIAPDQMPLIWDRYYKVDKVHRRATIGTGLGLSIVKGILELHHAAYGVNSTIGVGSTFWFELPLITPPMPVPTQANTEE